MSAREAIQRGLLTAREAPNYPFQARRDRLVGSGIFDMHFERETGRVREVRVVQSTGHEILDRSAITALKRWRAKPGSIEVLRQPISFGEVPED